MTKYCRPGGFFLLLLAPAWFAVLVACGPGAGGSPAGPPPTNACSAARAQTEPDLMAWDPASRANLSRLRHQGVVAVRYAARGCDVELELLSNCIAPGSYEFAPYSANERKVAHNQNELFAALPVGAASLSAKLSGERALRTDYMLAGTHSLPPGTPVSADELTGLGCDRATHVVSAIYVGGFAMTAGESRTMDASASFFGADVSARTSADVENLADEGNEQACRTAQAEHREHDACAVPLRIGLIPLRRAAGGEAAQASTAAAALPAIAPAALVTSSKLEAEPAERAAYDAARDAERASAADPTSVANAWKKLDATSRQDAIKRLATERAKLWVTFASREAARAKQQPSDDARLQKLLPLKSLSLASKETLLRDYITLHGRRAAGLVIETMQPEAERRTLEVVLALPVGLRDARSLFEECEQGNASSCVMLGKAYLDKRLIPETGIDQERLSVIVKEHALVGVQLLQKGCDRASAEACDARANAKLEGDQAGQTEAAQRAADLYVERCEISDSAGACKAALARVSSRGNAEQTRAAKQRIAPLYEARCMNGDRPSCTPAAELFHDLADEAAVVRVQRKLAELMMKRCREGMGHECRDALKIAGARATRDDVLAKEATSLAIAIERAACERDDLYSCRLLAGLLMGEDQHPKAGEILRKVCMGRLSEETRYDRLSACSEAASIYVGGADGVPQNRALARQLKARVCNNGGDCEHTDGDYP